MKQNMDFSSEMSRLYKIKWQGYSRTLQEIGVSYLGAVAISAKLNHSLVHSHVATYGIYLAPADQSGLNVCPYSSNCKANCLNGSGRNRLSILSGKNIIDRAKIIRTRLFFANREIFMRLLTYELEREQAKALEQGYHFSVRLNCTSDLSPELFKLNGKNILEMYPDVVFYDYTKVPHRIDVARKYPNYDITWSIDGSEQNREVGLEFLRNGGRVAVVYGEDMMPTSWYGYKTCDGDLTDYRLTDPEQVCLLKFKKTANNFHNGKFIMPNTSFIVTRSTSNVSWPQPNRFKQAA